MNSITSIFIIHDHYYYYHHDRSIEIEKYEQWIKQHPALYEYYLTFLQSLTSAVLAVQSIASGISVD